MLEENLRDAKDIMHNILTQSIVVGGGEEVSLVKAAAAFDPSNPLTSSLRKIVLNMIEFPEETESMLREIELLEEDLRK